MVVKKVGGKAKSVSATVSFLKLSADTGKSVKWKSILIKKYYLPKILNNYII